MGVNSEIRNLLTCALLHLDPRIPDKRLALNSILIEVSLFNFENPCSYDELKAQIDALVIQKDFLGDEDIHNSIEDCIKRKSVAETEGNYLLSENRRNSLQEAFTSSENTFQQVTKGLKERIELEVNENLPDDYPEKIAHIVRRVITEEVYESSIQLARENLTIEEMIFRLEESNPIKNIEDSLLEFLPKKRELFRKKIVGGIVDYFRDLPIELQEMLRLVHLNVLINQILGLDPSMVKMLRDWFSKRRLYLDTNVVLSYIFEGQIKHPIVLEVIQSTLDLQIQLLISPITLDEIKSQIDRSNKNYQLSQRIPIVEILAHAGDDAILATFSRLKHSQPSLQWKTFIQPFESLEETLLSYNILVEDKGFEEVPNHENFDEIRKRILESKPPYASDNVINHDTSNCILIFLLREIYPPDERGQIVWLMTIDTSLRHSQKRLVSSKLIPEPYCMQVSDWGDIVRPAQSLLGFVFNDFIGYLAQSRLGAVVDSQFIQLDFLETIHDSEFDIDRLLILHPDQVKATLSNLQTNREAKTLLREAIQEEDPGVKKALLLKFDELFNQAIEDTDPVKSIKEEKDQKINLLETRVEDLSGTVMELSVRVEEAESTWGYRLSSWIKHLFKS